MNTLNWEKWAIEMLRRRNLTEPPEHVLERAYRIGAVRRGLPLWFAAAAMLTVAVTAGILMTQRQAPSLPSVPPESTVRSGEVTVIEPVGELDRMPTLFAWEPDERAASYRLRLLAVDDRVLFERTTDRTTLELPDATAATLHAAVTYTWQVDALDAGGALVARSQPARFEIRP